MAAEKKKVGAAACVASVSVGMSARNVEREPKSGKLFLLTENSTTETLA